MTIFSVVEITLVNK